MPLNLEVEKRKTPKVIDNLFKGDTHVSTGRLSEIVRDLQIQNAIRNCSTTTDLTDSSTGTAGVAFRVGDKKGGVVVTTAIAADADILPQIRIPVVNPTAGTNLYDRSNGATALQTITPNIKELVARANTIAGLVGVTKVTNNVESGAVDGTLSAVTKDPAAVTSGGMNKSDIQDKFVRIAKYFGHLAVFVNVLAKATGKDLLEDSTKQSYSARSGNAGSYTYTYGTSIDVPIIETYGPKFVYNAHVDYSNSQFTGHVEDLDFSAYSTTYAAGVSAAGAGIDSDSGDQFLSDCANVLSTIAAKLNSITSETQPTPKYHA